jgi:arylsulfatase A
MAALLAGCAGAPRTSAPRPNVLLLYADDLGWNDLGCYGSAGHRTPAIDALAGAGARFTDAYAAAAVCAPSRASLMTGRDVLAHGIYCINDPEQRHPEARLLDSPTNQRRLPRELPTLAEALQRAGYRTGCYGKWHLGHDGDQVSEWHPLARGFEEAVQTRSPSGKKRYFYPTFSTIPEVPIEAGVHMSDFVSDQAKAFLDRDDGRPWFLYLPYFSVHGPREAKPESLRAAKARGLKGRDAVYAAMCADLDAAVGAVLTHLEARGLADDTIVIFASDNGGTIASDNAPLRAGKGWLFDGGVRTPLIVRWPGVTAPGEVHRAPVTQLDLFPTLCRAAGAAVAPELDGVDLAPLLAGGDLADRPLRFHAPDYGAFRQGAFARKPTSALRQGGLKLLYDHETQRAALYDLSRDLSESQDLSGARPKRTSALEDALRRWLRENAALQPTPRSSRRR